MSWINKRKEMIKRGVDNGFKRSEIKDRCSGRTTAIALKVIGTCLETPEISFAIKQKSI